MLPWSILPKSLVFRSLYIPHSNFGMYNSFRTKKNYEMKDSMVLVIVYFLFLKYVLKCSTGARCYTWQTMRIFGTLKSIYQITRFRYWVHFWDSHVLLNFLGYQHAPLSATIRSLWEPVDFQDMIHICSCFPLVKMVLIQCFCSAYSPCDSTHQASSFILFCENSRIELYKRMLSIFSFCLKLCNFWAWTLYWLLTTLIL